MTSCNVAGRCLHLLASCRITVKSLNERTDLPALAAEVVEKCKLIHPSKVHGCTTAALQWQKRQLRTASCSAPYMQLQQLEHSNCHKREEHSWQMQFATLAAGNSCFACTIAALEQVCMLPAVHDGVACCCEEHVLPMLLPHHTG